MGKKEKAGYARVNRNNLYLFHSEMFTYDGLPDTVNPIYLERFLQLEGSAAIVRFNGQWIATSAEEVPGNGLDPLDVYGEGTDVLYVTRNGHSGRVRRADCAFFHNNATYTPCMDIFTDAARLTEIDVSLDFLIFWTRIFPLIQTRDAKTKDMIEQAFREMKSGKPLTVVSQSLLEEFLTSPDIQSIQLTSPDLADKMQYIAKLREDLERWHFTRYGQAQQKDTKSAQQSVEEVTGDTSTSFIIPENMLKERKKGIEKFNALSGLSASVRLSDAWQMEIERYTEKEEKEEGNYADVAEPGGDTGSGDTDQ